MTALIVHGIGALVTCDPQVGAAPGVVRDAALVARDGVIVYAGPEAGLDRSAVPRGALEIQARGAAVVPGFVDAHTHIVWLGDRGDEYAQCASGATYEEIARRGGGIRSTVAKTRAASEEALFESARDRLRRLMAEGVTTVEIKSGYGLSTESELKMLRVARRLGRELALDVVTTLLGAHALPPEYEGRQKEYVELVCREMIPAAAEAKLADAVDAFCERIAFTREETAAVFEAARERGLPVKLHADQLSDLGGGALAARFAALSADHLEYSSEASIAAMAQAGTVAVLLPGAFYFLGERRLPPIEALRRHRVPIALASDCNPGSSPALSLLLMLNLAATLFRLTPEEALFGITRHAATALGLGRDRGRLAPGMKADFALWDIDHPAELVYWIGRNPCAGVVKDSVPLVRP